MQCEECILQSSQPVPLNRTQELKKNHRQLTGGLQGVIDSFRRESGRQDSNLRRPGPKPGALARLSYAPS